MVRLELDLDQDRMPVLADPTQLEMAVLNLAINARDAMPDGGELRIATLPSRIERDAELPPGDYLQVRVGDTGAGMPTEVAARAFDPFFTTKGVGKGTGLGLSQVYGFAKQAGGTARLDSMPGRGTVVTLFLRRADQQPDDAAAEPHAMDQPSVVQAAEVLVVDDDQDVRQILAETLRDLGYRVREAEGGEAALALLEQAPPDVLVVDFAMPGMNGAELARAVRALHPRLPVVFASGYAETAAIDAAIEGPPLLLRKPFRMEELEAILATALERASGPGGG
jgi:CheY-like chemotaxis protein